MKSIETNLCRILESWFKELLPLQPESNVVSVASFWIGSLKIIFNHAYSDMLMPAKNYTYFITVTHNPINLTTYINQLLKTRNVKKTAEVEP